MNESESETEESGSGLHERESILPDLTRGGVSESSEAVERLDCGVHESRGFADGYQQERVLRRQQHLALSLILLGSLCSGL